MIYCQGKFLFVHIPRTAGMSITNTLAPIVTNPGIFEGYSLIASGTDIWRTFHRHSTANDLARLIPDWDDIYKFAVYRPDEEIFESDYRLHKSYHDKIGNGKLSRCWEKTVKISRNENLEEFIERRWKPWIREKTCWEYWTGNYDFHKFQFSDIKNEFKTILKDLNLEEVELKHLNGA